MLSAILEYYTSQSLVNVQLRTDNIQGVYTVMWQIAALSTLIFYITMCTVRYQNMVKFVQWDTVNFLTSTSGALAIDISCNCSTYMCNVASIYDVKANYSTISHAIKGELNIVNRLLGGFCSRRDWHSTVLITCIMVIMLD